MGTLELQKIVEKLAISQAETDRQIKESQAETNRQMKATDKKIKELGMMSELKKPIAY